MTLYRRIDRFIHHLATASALAGGAVLIALVLITVASVAGRALDVAGLGQIPGDFELVEAGTAFAVFAFLPWCQITRGHAAVEILTDRFPAKVRTMLAMLADWLFLAAALVVAWRLWLGLLDQIAFPQTTLILQFPLWWAYAGAMAGAALFVVVSAWCALRGTMALTRPEWTESAP